MCDISWPLASLLVATVAALGSIVCVAMVTRAIRSTATQALEEFARSKDIDIPDQTRPLRRFRL